MSFIYNEVKPDAIKSTYSENDLIDFRINYAGQTLLKNHFYLTGFIALYDSSGNKVETNSDTQCFYNNMLGAHSFINAITTSMEKLGSVENFLDYNGYQQVKTAGSVVPDDLFNSSMKAELRIPENESTFRLLSAGEVSSAGRHKDASFFLKPDICINNTVGDGNFSYNNHGEIRVSVRLETNQRALFGSDCQTGAGGQNYTYKMTDVRMFYITRADIEAVKPLEMTVKGTTISQINSGSGIVNIKSPLTADRIIMRFINADNDNDIVPNSLSLEQLRGLTSVEYVYNNNTNGMISYEIDNLPEMLHYTEMAFNGNKNSFSLTRLEANNGFCLGFNFGYKQLQNSKISIQLNSSTTAETNIYSYLLGIVSV